MIEHIVLALLIQLAIVLIWKNWIAGTAAACAWSISREITQAEYRWIEHHGDGLRANMPWWGGLDPLVWQYPDPWLDWIVPCALAIGIALIARSRRAQR